MAYSKKNIIAKSTYHPRIFLCIIIVELILIGLFRFLPVKKLPDKKEQEFHFSKEETVLEQSIATRQQNSPPPPPPQPSIPVEVPNDKVIQQKIDVKNINIETDYSDPLSTSPGNGNEAGKGYKGVYVNHAGQPPQIVRIVEASISDQAEQAGIKAKIYVNFWVNEEGNVDKAKIDKIELYQGRGKDFKLVNKIGYGIQEDIIDAAMKWKFRPARDDDNVVKAITEQIFTIGF